MPSKKPVAAKAVASKAKPAPAPETGKVVWADKVAAFKRVWALPTALLMLIVAAAGLSFALRESSNAPQAATPAVTATMKADAAAKAPASAAAPAAAPKTGETTGAAAKPVSITGCLQQDGAGYVLRDTEGTDAPKSRSWKSGFLRKRSASIDLFDTTNPTHLGAHVGERVTVTGPLTDREMKVQSLRRVAATCQ